MEFGGEVPGHAEHAHGVGTVRIHRKIEHDVGGDSQGVSDRLSERGAGGQLHDAGVVVAESELAARAEHAVRPLAPQLAAFDVHAPGHGGAKRGERHNVALGEVPSTAGDLDRFGLVGRRDDVDETNLVGVWVRTDGAYLRGDDAVEALPDPLHAFHLETEAVEHGGEFVDGQRDGNQFA